MNGQVPTAALAESPSTAEPGRRSGRLRAWWHALVGVIGAVTALVPHVLHHVGLLAGTALVAGAGGTTLFAVVGLAASVPFLLRLRRRFHSWWAPAIGLAVFAVMFAISTLVLGPAINGGGDTRPGGGLPTPAIDTSPGGGQPTPAFDHNAHHGG